VSSHARRENLDYQLRHPTNTDRGKIPLECSTVRPSSQRKEAYSSPKRQRYKKKEELDVPLLQKKGTHQIRMQKVQNGQFTLGTRLTEERRSQKYPSRVKNFPVEEGTNFFFFF